MIFISAEHTPETRIRLGKTRVIFCTRPGDGPKNSRPRAPRLKPGPRFRRHTFLWMDGYFFSRCSRPWRRWPHRNPPAMRRAPARSNSSVMARNFRDRWCFHEMGRLMRQWCSFTARENRPESESGTNSSPGKESPRWSTTNAAPASPAANTKATRASAKRTFPCWQTMPYPR